MSIMIWGVLITAVIFLALIMCLALKPGAITRTIEIMMIIALILGVLFYGTGYCVKAQDLESLFSQTIQAAMAIMLMFIGKNAYSAIASSCPLFAIPGFTLIFWAAHLLAMYATTSAVISKLGGHLLQKLRMGRLRFQDVLIVRGSSADDIGFVKTALKNNPRLHLLFISKSFDNNLNSSILGLGGIPLEEKTLLSDRAGKWIDLLGVRHDPRRRLEICSLTENDPKTKEFFLYFLDQMKAKNISAGQVHFLINASSEYSFEFLRTACDSSGRIIQARIFTAYDLAAENLVKTASPYQIETFDENGRAQKDVSVMIIGFGSTGQTMLRKIAVHSRFAGSDLRVTVCDLEPDRTSAFRLTYSYLMEMCHVSLLKADALGNGFFEKMQEMNSMPDYILVCAGDPEENERIAGSLRMLRKAHPEMFAEKLILAQCDKNRIVLNDCRVDEKGKIACVYSTPSGDDRTLRDIEIPNLNPKELINGEDEKRVFAVNAIYAKQAGQDPDEAWNRLDYISRESSRSSASFIPALLAEAHLNEKEVSDGTFTELAKNHPVLFENLSRTEHLRWNAFEASNGVRPMNYEEMKQRFESGAHSIQKDIPPCGIGGRHACLVPWEDLDRLSGQYRDLTGKDIDFRQMDSNNVLNIPAVLSYR